MCTQVHGDHDGVFKALNSELKREVLAVHSGAGAAHSLLHGAVFASDDADGRAPSTEHWALMGDEEQRLGAAGVMEATARLSGQTLAQIAARDHTAAVSAPKVAASAAAAAAAEARWMQARPGATPQQAPTSGSEAMEAGAEESAGHEQWRSYEHSDPATEQAEAAAHRLEE